MSYADFLRARIFKPLGMTSTYVYAVPDTLIPQRVTGYTRGPDGWRPAGYFSLTHGYSAGNLLSTVDDLARWNAAIEQGRLLSRRWWDRAFTSFSRNDGRNPRYSAGWFLTRIGDLETAEHAGNFMGGIASVVRIPSKRIFVAVLANADPAPVDPERLSLQLAAHAAGLSADPPEIRLSSDKLDEYVGAYQSEGGDVRTITRDGGSLYSQRAGGQKVRIYPIGEDLFYFPVNGMSIRFDREDGRVMSVRLVPRQNAPGAPARRVNTKTNAGL
jgi:CubicO group peptidase (beta-lactamase class C family)